MNTFTKLFLRKPVFTVVLTLLLTFAWDFPASALRRA